MIHYHIIKLFLCHRKLYDIQSIQILEIFNPTCPPLVGAQAKVLLESLILYIGSSLCPSDLITHFSMNINKQTLSIYRRYFKPFLQKFCYNKYVAIYMLFDFSKQNLPLTSYRSPFEMIILTDNSSMYMYVPDLDMCIFCVLLVNQCCVK